MNRAVVARRVLVAALCVYAALLVLAAWRAEIRPAALDFATDVARRTLGLAGIPPGVAVFSANTPGAPDAKIAALCLEVRAIDGRGGARERTRRLYPPDGVDCPVEPPRLWVRGEEIFLQRAVVMLRADVASSRRAGLDRARRDFAELLARSIGAHFVARDAASRAGVAPDARAEAAERRALLWTETRLSYRTHRRSERVVALMQWPDVAEPRVLVAWQPDEKTLVERGWDTGEP